MVGFCRVMRKRATQAVPITLHCFCMLSLVRVGIIGTGFGGSVHLPGFLNIPDAQVVGIVSSHPEKSADFAQKYSLPKTFTSWQEMIASDEIDLISVATPQALHQEIVSAAIRAGKSVLCEKPFTLHAADARNILEEAEAAGVVHAIDFEFRELPAWQLLHERLASGVIGAVKSADLRWVVGSWANPERPWGWQCDSAQSGGVISALGVHLFDAAEWLLGSMLSLRGETGITVIERRDANGHMKPVTSVDHATITMKTSTNVLVSVALSNVDANGSGLSITVRGDRGVLIVESTSKDYGSGFCVKEEIGDAEPVVILKDDTPVGVDARIPPFQSLAARVVAAVQKQDPSFQPSFREGLRAQMILEAVMQSRGMEVEI